MKIGVDGGGTKTECIFIDAHGETLAHHTAPGCNPNVVGPEQAREIFSEAIHALLAKSEIGNQKPKIAATHLFMAGSQSFWREIAAALALEKIFGTVEAVDDSRPVLELATGGAPGLVLHAGTGSFVAARAPDGTIRYAGGLGWKLGDAGSGYEIGRRAVARTVLELQGWEEPSRLATVVCNAAQADDAGAITRFFHQHTESNRQVAALAPAMLRLASENDPIARQLIADVCQPLLELAQQVAGKLFPGTPAQQLRAALSGPILTHPFVVDTLTPRSSLALFAITEPPIEGVRRLLLKS